jgi:hypothetical protein
MKPIQTPTHPRAHLLKKKGRRRIMALHFYSSSTNLQVILKRIRTFLYICLEILVQVHVMKGGDYPCQQHAVLVHMRIH